MSAPVRPRQATFAAGLIIGGSVLLVLSAFDTLSGIQSLDMREQIEDFLAEPPASGLGLSVADVQTIVRVLTMIAAACAAAMAVLGVSALQRSRAARLALSVLAPVLAITGLVTGGVFAPVVTVAVVMLWLQPSRDWFDGIERRAEPAPRRAPERQTTWPPPTPPAPTAPTPPSAPSAPTAPSAPSSEPRPYAGFGTAPTPYGAPTPDAPASYPLATPTRRPPAVLWSCVLAWTFSAVIAAMMVLSAIVIGLSPEGVLDEVRERDARLAADITEDLLVATMVTVAVIVVLWCVAASVFAWFAHRRARWAHVALLVSAAVAGLLCLLGVAVGSFPLLVPLAGCAGTVALLLRPEARAWYAGRGTI